MTIRQAMEEFLEKSEWDAQIECDEESGENSLSTRLKVAGQVFDLGIFGNEKQDRLTLVLAPPFRAIEGKHAELCQFFNYLSELYLFTGRLSMGMEGGIRYKAILDTDGLEPSHAIIRNMLNSAVALFDCHIEQIAALAMTKKTFIETMAEYEKKRSLREARNNMG